jgi:hypothetical protein
MLYLVCEKVGRGFIIYLLNHERKWLEIAPELMSMGADAVFRLPDCQAIKWWGYGFPVFWMEINPKIIPNVFFQRVARVLGREIKRELTPISLWHYLFSDCCRKIRPLEFLDEIRGRAAQLLGPLQIGEGPEHAEGPCNPATLEDCKSCPSREGDGCKFPREPKVEGLPEAEPGR